MAMNSGAGAAGSVRAGRAFVELFTDDTRLREGLAKAATRVAAFGKLAGSLGGTLGGGIGGLGSRLSAGFALAGRTLTTSFKAAGAELQKIGGAGVAIGGGALGGLALLTKAAVERAERIKILGDRFGATAESLSGLAYAFETVNVPFDDFANVLENLPERLSKATEAGDEMGNLLRRMHLDPNDLLNQPLDVVFEKLADAMSRVPNAFDRGRIASDLFSDAGQALIPILSKGSGELRRLAEEGRLTGQVLDNDTAAAAQKASQAFSRGWGAIRNAALSVGLALLPATERIEDFSGRIVRGAKFVREWVQENRGLVLGAAALAGGLVAAGVAAVALGPLVAGAGAVLGGVLSLAGTALGGVLSIVGTGVNLLGWAVGMAISMAGNLIGNLGSMSLHLFKLAASFGWVGVVIGGVVAAGAALAAYMFDWKSFASSLAGNATAAFGGVAGEIGRTSLSLAELGGEVLGRVRAGFAAFAGEAVEAWNVITEAAGAGKYQDALRYAIAFGKVQFLEMKQFFIANWGDFVDSFVSRFVKGLEEVKAAAAKIVPEFLGGTGDNPLIEFKHPWADVDPIRISGTRRVREAPGGGGPERGRAITPDGKPLPQPVDPRLVDVRKELDAARKALAAARIEAKAPPPPLAEPLRPRFLPRGLNLLGEIAQAGNDPERLAALRKKHGIEIGQREFNDLPAAVRGSFSGAAAGQAFGIGDSIAQRQLAVEEKQVEKLEAIDQRLANMKVTAFK